MQITNIFNANATHTAHAKGRQLRASQGHSRLVRAAAHDVQQSVRNGMLLTGAVLIGLSAGLGLHQPHLLPGLIAILVGLAVLSVALVRRIESDMQRVLENQVHPQARMRQECAELITLQPHTNGVPAMKRAAEQVVLVRSSLSRVGRQARELLSVQETRALFEEGVRVSA